GSTNVRTTALRETGRPPAKAAAALCAAGPLVRTTAIAAGGRPLDWATMVSERLTAGAMSVALPNRKRSGEYPAQTYLGMDPAVVDHLHGDIEDHREPDIGDPPVALDVARNEIGSDAHQRDGENQPDDQY